MMQDDPGRAEELELITRASNGDHEAFRGLVVIYEPMLLGYLTRMLGESESAHDVAQETFVAAFHALPRWHLPNAVEGNYQAGYSRDGSSIQQSSASIHLLGSWLYRIATNQALSFLRKQAAYERTQMRSLRKGPWSGTMGHRELTTRDDMTLEDHYVARELLREALQHLAEEDATCLVLHFVAGERYAEIAAQLDLTPEAVRKRVSRALIALRKVYTALDTEVLS